MNYTKIYDDLIEKVVFRGWVKGSTSGYCERHHILPRSMGGSDDPSNIVVVTAREHLILHKLLYKIHKNYKMAYALHCMVHDRRNSRIGLKLNSRDYQQAREAASFANRNRPCRKGKVFITDEAKLKMSKAHKGKKLSKATKEKMSKSRIGNTCRSEGVYFTPYGSGRSLKHLAKINNCSTTTIQHRCKKLKLKHNGWYYLKDVPQGCWEDIPQNEKRVTDYTHKKLEGKVDYSKYNSLLEKVYL